MMSTIHNGKVLDWHFKKMNEGHYAFYIGDIYIGQLFHMSKLNYWSVVGATHKTTSTGGKIYPVDGFFRRWKAAEFLLKMEGYE